MKQPIDPKDIRKGDRIRLEYNDVKPGNLAAEEWESDGRTYSANVDGKHYLLERPAPPVTVRREDLDRLRDAEQRWFDRYGHNPDLAVADLHVSLCALIDNADTGDTP